MADTACYSGRMNRAVRMGLSLSLGAGGLTALGAYAVAGKSSQVFGPSVYRGPGHRRSVALTFDDGPSGGSLRLLEYLELHGVKATFFQCGRNVERHPEISRGIYAAGHEIGNHTYSHPQLCPGIGREMSWRSPSFIYKELELTQAILRSEVGTTPGLVRAPYGLRWFGIGAAQARLHLLGVMWTVIGNDWKLPADLICRRVLRRTSPGGIICLHDGRDIQPNPDVSEMLLAVQEIVPRLQDQGYGFETVSELLKA